MLLWQSKKPSPLANTKTKRPSNGATNQGKNMPNIEVKELDLYGSASRVIVDGQTVTVRHSAILKNGRVANTVRGFVVSIEVSAQLKKLIADAVRTEAKQQCRLIAAQLEDEHDTQESLARSVYA